MTGRAIVEWWVPGQICLVQRTREIDAGIVEIHIGGAVGEAAGPHLGSLSTEFGGCDRCEVCSRDYATVPLKTE